MEEYVTQRDIVEATGWSQPTISRRLSELPSLIKKTYGNVTVFHSQSLPDDWKVKLEAYFKTK